MHFYTLSFGQWSHAAYGGFVRDRVYYKGYKWTPVVKIKLRKCGV